jgi:hypothetical protein
MAAGMHVDVILLAGTGASVVAAAMIVLSFVLARAPANQSGGR